MLKSMTGYGKTIFELPGKKLTIEIKTLNSKQLDINARIPSVYKEKEMEMRALMSQKLERGKVDFNIYLEETGEETHYTFNKKLITHYYNELKTISSGLDHKMETDLFYLTMRLPDVMKTEYKDLEEEEWKGIKKALMEVINQTDEYRVKEGAIMEKDIGQRTANIKYLLTQIDPFEKERIEKTKQRIWSELENLKEKEDIDKNRFEQELIYYLEKFDINEEKVRLVNHCNYFSETMNTNAASGKKLAFISQEMGREINTIGSKAYHAEIQKLVIQMKDELEKIKEQLMNVL
jgi:uncharacterized protein (TIGR00255 family)